MKSMKCSHLGGPESCTTKFRANTWEEMKVKSQKHGMEMYKKQDEEHLDAMDKMSALMQDHDAMEEWMEGKKKDFDALPEE